MSIDEIVVVSGLSSGLLLGILSIIAGFILSFLAKKKSKEDNLEKENISKIAKTAFLQTEEAKLRALEEIAKKLPDGLDIKEFEKKFQSSLRVHGGIHIHQLTDENNGFAEKLVNNYHSQALSQAKFQFWFSVTAATIGFALILFFSLGIDHKNFVEYIKILPGAVIDAVAFLFFKQAEQTRQRATELYDRLRNDRQLERAETVVDSIEDVKIRSVVKAQIALHMAGMKPKNLELPTLSSHSPETTEY